MNNKELTNKIINVLEEQGFKINPKIETIENNKDVYRKLQQKSRLEQIQLHRNFLEQNIKKIKKYMLNGNTFNPEKIELELKEVKRDTIEEVLFKWWNLIWWSVPYQRAYGRQMRFILWDKTHNAPFGLIGLQSPVLKLSVRDQYLGIPKASLDLWINKSMQAQRLGALPPYNSLIGGKMVALAMTSNEIIEFYRKKYTGIKTRLQNRIIEPDLLFITTSSAFGRSSIYNRLKYCEQNVAISLGYTKGFGSFHIPQELYKEIQEFLISNNIDVSTTFGKGPSRKIKLLDTAFRLLNIPNYSFHNLRREFFLFPLASNLENVISNNDKPQYYNRSLNGLVSFWKNRWCIPRYLRYDKWEPFNPESFLLKAEQEILNN